MNVYVLPVSVAAQNLSLGLSGPCWCCKIGPLHECEIFY